MSDGYYGWAASGVRMNSKSSQDFRWSVRLNGGTWIAIGMATKLQLKDDLITQYDENAIIYHPMSSQMNKGKINSGLNFTKAKAGDVIQFRFQAQLKKFSFSFVCTIFRY